MREKGKERKYWWNIILSGLAKIEKFELAEELEEEEDEEKTEIKEKKKYAYFKKISGLNSTELAILIALLNSEPNLVETEGKICRSARGGGSGYYAEEEPLFKIAKLSVKIDKKNDTAPSYKFDILLMINNVWICNEISDSLCWTGAWEGAFKEKIRDLIPEPLRDEVKLELDQARKEMKRILTALNREDRP